MTERRRKVKTIYKFISLFCGIGGGTNGFLRSQGEWKGAVGRFEALVGIDADPMICRNYERITGSPAACMDLFSRQQYIDFHDQEPPVDWKEVTAADIRYVCGGEYPDVIFTSPPCKGFSGLLPEKSAKTKKYQALNQLTLRGIKLCLDAFEDDLPALFLLENVPRIKTRGKKLLDEIKALLHSYGYVTDDADHDCGEIGGLGQRRKRYLLIARQEQKCCSFVYKPEKKPLKTIGDIIGPLPMPDDPIAGPLHRLPRLQWKTWQRLALIRAGGDWRDLEKIDWHNLRITYEPRKGALGVADWNEPSGAVTGAAGYGRSNGTQAVADPRLPEREGRHPGVYQVVRFDEPAPCVTGTRFGSGALAVSDPRTGFAEGTHRSIYRVQSWEEVSGTVTGAIGPNNGAICINDPRLQHQAGRYSNKFQIHDWNEQAATITGTSDIQAGAPSIADPRLNCSPRSGTMGVQAWDEPGKTVIGSGDIHAGAAAVADPRIPEAHEKGVFVIIAEDGTWHRPLTTFELAALQGFDYLADGSIFTLEGGSDAKCREWIGNAVPPEAAEAIGNVMLAALMPSQEGVWVLGHTDIWVGPDDAEKEVEFAH